MDDIIGSALTEGRGRPAKILIIDDEERVLSALYSLLRDRHDYMTATTAPEALEDLKEETRDLALSDMMMPGMSGLQMLGEINRLTRDTVVVLISENLNIQSAIEALRRGAFDYASRPSNLSDAENAVRRAPRRQALRRANQQHEQHLEEMVSLRTSEAAAKELIQRAGKHSGPQLVRASLSIPHNSRAEARQAATEPGLALKERPSGRKARYSLPTTSADRIAGSWTESGGSPA